MYNVYILGIEGFIYFCQQSPNMWPLRWIANSLSKIRLPILSTELFFISCVTDGV